MLCVVGGTLLKKETMNRISQFCIVFNRDEKNFLYFSRNNNFYEISDEVKKFIKNEVNCSSFSALGQKDKAAIEKLKNIKAICTKADDQEYIDDLRLNHLIMSFNLSNINLTVLPTIACNLRCPYCFEQNKPNDMMSEKTADRLVDFLSEHRYAETYSLTWFGGEPLVNIKMMEYLLGKLDNPDFLKRTYHSIVTNGTLLKGRAIELFEKYPLDSVQITLDGTKELHDKKRFFQDGRGSYEIILKNLDDFVKRCPKTVVSVRVNLDGSNVHLYKEIESMINSRYKGFKVRCYPAILRVNPGCNPEGFLAPMDVVAFHRDNSFGENGKFYFYPSHKSKGCTATQVSSYVIGPKGEIYKCWEHVGDKNCVVGSIFSNESQNKRLLNKLLLNGHCYNDAKCLECAILPLCTGGCADKRMKLADCQNDGSLCDYLSFDNNSALEDFLYQAYKSRTL